ncbi:hypothetical protein AURANDRAFT_67728 [Aureococcus anophagefferens]|uniref:Uncharacterized protein n=1 Tax=Aureococcus anophagefferens TaxID=44056 RepID=F0YM66_AURAN|nr:hypothetical protein AURANDRAFT_67728 [Aureococcus anophagefferens]EGB03795.1 hypothetical protein AURANDRAFT_67728 [Aureococcus anophagefferens]|eukprot:XP_009041524.1 hypothetical protein AURANDRAFT_67728 [Aureococcus anophagefferens]
MPISKMEPIPNILLSGMACWNQYPPYQLRLCSKTTFMAQRGQKRAADDDGEAAFLADLDGLFEPDEPTALVDAKKQKGRPLGSVSGPSSRPTLFLKACVDAKAGKAWLMVRYKCSHEIHKVYNGGAPTFWAFDEGPKSRLAIDALPLRGADEPGIAHVHNERRGPGNNRYLTYNETEGLNNQRIALENARLMAILLNRTLVVPDTIPPHDAGDPFPTKTCRVFTCDSLRVPWVSQRYFEDHRKRWPTRIRDDAARCGDVATCEDFLLDPPKNVVVEVPVDKTMYHMSLSSPKRWVLSKMKDDRELNPNVLTVNSRLITRAKMIVDKLGAAYDAAHLRTGDYFDALYTDEFGVFWSAEREIL